MPSLSMPVTRLAFGARRRSRSSQTWRWRFIGSLAVFRKAKAEARKALDIDDTLAEAHVSLAYTLFRGDWKWADSEKEFRQALAINPRSAQAHQWYANLLVVLGRADEAIAHTK